MFVSGFGKAIIKLWSQEVYEHKWKGVRKSGNLQMWLNYNIRFIFHLSHELQQILQDYKKLIFSC